MERLSYSRDVDLISENVSSLSEQFQALHFRNHNGMLSDFVGEITLYRIRLQFGQDVPDSGQEHPAREMRVDFTFLLLWSFRGQQPAQETKCFAEGNTDISTLISEMRTTAVNGAAEKPGTVRISSSWCG